MELKKCQNGHYYDASIYEECPTCKETQYGGRTMGLSEERETPFPIPPQDERTAPLQDGYTAPVQNGYTAPLKDGYTVPLTDDRYAGPRNLDDGQTVAVVHQELGIDPVVGWLVSVSGQEKGRDYRIHSDNNFIGRSETMDIRIRGDETISRINHAVVAYDTRDKIFYFAPGGGRSINRVNGKAVLAMVPLNAYDEIEIGRTRLIFVPLCGERFEWKNE